MSHSIIQTNDYPKPLCEFRNIAQIVFWFSVKHQKYKNAGSFQSLQSNRRPGTAAQHLSWGIIVSVMKQTENTALAGFVRQRQWTHFLVI